LLLLPLLLPAAAGGISGSGDALLPEAGGLWQQLIRADAGSILETLSNKGLQ
jgi:hypothetical protein